LPHCHAGRGRQPESRYPGPDPSLGTGYFADAKFRHDSEHVRAETALRCSGQPVEPLAKLKDRKFVEVTLDNFDDVLASMKPHLQFSVENKLSDDPNAGKIGVDLTFKSLDDFSPDAVARQVGPLRELLDLRTKLSDLRGTLQSNEKLDEILQSTLSDTEKMNKLKSEMGEGGGNG